MQTQTHGIRVPDDLWQAAKLEAERRGETITAVIVRYLRRYARNGAK